MAAEAGPLEDVQTNPQVRFTETSTAVILEPAGGPGEVGLVYIPGAKVEAAAYAATMADVVAEDGVTVVITKPWLNLAFFDLRPLSAFTDLVPGIDQWIVGGHPWAGCGRVSSPVTPTPSHCSRRTAPVTSRDRICR